MLGGWNSAGVRCVAWGLAPKVCVHLRKQDIERKRQNDGKQTQTNSLKIVDKRNFEFPFMWSEAFRVGLTFVTPAGILSYIDHKLSVPLETTRCGRCTLGPHKFRVWQLYCKSLCLLFLEVPLNVSNGISCQKAISPIWTLIYFVHCGLSVHCTKLKWDR